MSPSPLPAVPARRSPAACGLALLLVAALLAPLAAPTAQAQYFGRNKVQYDDFDFKRLNTDHFEVYFYPEERQAVEDAARMAERWYRRHSRTFLREFDKPKPLIFYANDADFQQTNVISGQVGQGTGGVTESLKERVVMPLTGSYAATDHVLGHELVHSFQYDIALRGDVQGFSLRNLPLWLVEGMAEYLSLGREHPHTAMWLRDAMLRDDLPTTEQMTRDMRTYFPYRYGQAYMAYVGGKYGDAAVANLYKLAGRVGVDSAFVYALNIQADSLSREWQEAVRTQYMPAVEGRLPIDSVGTAVLGDPAADNQLNISPAASPDGRYIAYIARQNIFTTNLLVADAETGEVVQALGSTRSNPHFDALRFINSAGAWSPDGRKLAFVTFVEGDNEINAFDVKTGEITERTAVAGIGAITNLAWSPEGDRLAFTGLEGGISDLYVLNLRTKEVRQLTNDRYADMQPAWSPDGQTLAFTTDRGEDGTNFRTLRYGAYRIGLIDVASREMRTVRPFDRGMQHNPQFSPDGRSLYFVADHDGFKDIYRYNLQEERTYRVTHLQTGVSGITATSPAMSVAGQSGLVVFSAYANGGYTVRRLEPEEAQGVPLEGRSLALADDAPTARDSLVTAALLPPPQPPNEGLVGNYLADATTGLPDDQNFEEARYSNRLTLDYISSAGAGVQFGGPFGTGVAGGIGFFFSDMLGNQNLSLFLQANGTFRDIGGGAFYLNRANRINWGAGASHTPFVQGGITRYNTGTLDGGGVRTAVFLQRLYITGVDGLARYPLSQTRRFEVSVGGDRFADDIQAVDLFTGEDVNLSQFERGSDYLGRVGLAYVGDFSNFAFTSPAQGGRYRFGVTPTVGSANFATVRLDYRRYFFAEPVTFAVRGLHAGNYGAEIDSDLLGFPIGQEFMGEPFRQGFLRGYSYTSVFNEECRFGGVDPACDAVLDQLRGTRLGLASAEIRLPLVGTDAFGFVNFPYLPTELVLFTDAGVTWTQENLRDLTFTNESIEQVDSNGNPVGPFDTEAARPLVSAGISARFNVLGALVLETFYAKPFQRDIGWDFGILLQPGW